MSARKPTDNRHFPRSNASWPVLWHDANGVPQQGCTCDVGDGGAFVRPFLGSHIDDLHNGARITLVFVVGHNGHTRSYPVVTTVRWHGEHSAHRLPGLGVSFEDAKAMGTLRAFGK